MPTLKTVERKIKSTEGFTVHFLKNGQNVRSDQEGIPQYSYQRRAGNDMTVSEWKNARFYSNYPGYDANVMDKNNQVAHGSTKIENIR